jgi:hypothetical protein
MGSLTYWNPQGLSRPVMGLLYLLPFHKVQPLFSVLSQINPLNAELNPIRHLLASLGGATIVDVSMLRVNAVHVFRVISYRVYCNTILPSVPRSSKCAASLKFSHVDHLPCYM